MIWPKLSVNTCIRELDRKEKKRVDWWLLQHCQECCESCATLNVKNTPYRDGLNPYTNQQMKSGRIFMNSAQRTQYINLCHWRNGRSFGIPYHIGMKNCILDALETTSIYFSSVLGTQARKETAPNVSNHRYESTRYRTEKWIQGSDSLTY